MEKYLRIIRGLLAAIFVPAIIGIILLELAGRIFDPVGISYYPEMARYLDTMIVEEPIGYRNRPGLVGNYFGVPVSINKYGMRDDEITQKKSHNEFRILLLGDSVPFGIGVTSENMLSMQLQDMLNKGNSTELKYRVLNMGVPSYNTEQELIQLKNTGLMFEPDIVLLLFSQNDIENKMWVFEKRTGLMADITQRSYAGSLIYILFRTVHNKLLRPAGPDIEPVLNREIQLAFFGYQADDDRWAATRDAMLQMNALLAERGVPFVLLLNNANHALFDLWKRSAGIGRFHLANLKPWDDPRWLTEDESEYTNSFVDSHPNKDGTQILATLISEVLVSKNLLSRQ